MGQPLGWHAYLYPSLYTYIYMYIHTLPAILPRPCCRQRRRPGCALAAGNRGCCIDVQMTPEVAVDLPMLIPCLQSVLNLFHPIWGGEGTCNAVPIKAPAFTTYYEAWRLHGYSIISEHEGWNVRGRLPTYVAGGDVLDPGTKKHASVNEPHWSARKPADQWAWAGPSYICGDTFGYVGICACGDTVCMCL